MPLQRDYNRQMGIEVYERCLPWEMAHVLGDDHLLLYCHRCNAWAGRWDSDKPSGVIALTDRFETD